jgi:hypothetical protein
MVMVIFEPSREVSLFFLFMCQFPNSQSYSDSVWQPKEPGTEAVNLVNRYLYACTSARETCTI